MSGAHRAGVAAILGPPNAGKSALLNRLLGEKLAIVTPKPQTTRSSILGIHTLPGAQILFLDTPGLHESEKTLNAVLNEQVEAAAADCDVALLLVDLTRGWSDAHAQILSRVAAASKPVLLVGTKADVPRAARAAWPPPVDRPSFRVSSKTGEGVDALLAAVVQALPESPAYYPADELSDRPLRFLVAELVREAAFQELEQELPYSLATEVVEFDESRPELARIRVKLLVERESQKQIVIGRGGRVIKQIGIAARREIERLMDGHVYLELWVKVEPKWAKRRARIKALGYL